MSMIRLLDFHKHFNSETQNQVYALRGISVDIQEGDFVTIIGTNGSGKSTLLNAIAGSFLPDTGRVEIANRDVSHLADFRRAQWVARVFQNPFMGTVAEMSIAENLHMASLRGCGKYPTLGLNVERKGSLSEEVKTLEMGLEDRLDNLIGTLSGGQRQALTLLMAVIHRPHVLLLDEHTAALDPKAAGRADRRYGDSQHATGPGAWKSNTHDASGAGDRGPPDAGQESSDGERSVGSLRRAAQG
jgi:putative ABC transport system ATP-binding protein